MNYAQIAVLVIVAAAVIGIYLVTAPAPRQPMLGDVHKHADFKLYVNGEAFNFSQEKYMTTENRTLSPFIHLHDLEGEVIHQHITGATLAEFFESFGMAFNNTCFALDNGNAFCGGELKMFVNGRLNNEFGNYEFNDLDKILITYGGNDSTQQLNSVTDNACIHSGKCPERGLPGNESSCTTAGGCVV